MLYVDNAKHLKYIIDITIGYPDGIPVGLGDVVFSLRDQCKTVVYYRVYPIESVPQDEEALLNWMYARYAEKDALLGEFYRTGKFVVNSEMNTHSDSLSEKIISWNSHYCWSIFAFYIISTLFFGYITFHIFKYLVFAFF